VARSLSTWDCAELAKKLIDDGIVDSISPSSVQRILASQKLKPWRVHHWLSSKVVRDEAFRQTVRNICDLYTRQLGTHERVLSVDEKTSLQPRTRTSANRPARVPNEPVRVEHEYVRKGALNLFAAFDTRSGRVTGILRRRKRQVEFIELLELIDRDTPAEITLIHLVADNISIHRGQLVCAWLAAHPRFRMHFTPVHCSWMNQVEQWFSILQRKRFRAPNFADLADLEAKVLAFIDEWNETAHPFKWTATSLRQGVAPGRRLATTRAPLGRRPQSSRMMVTFLRWAVLSGRYLGCSFATVATVKTVPIRLFETPARRRALSRQCWAFARCVCARA
jgi:transposase